MNHKFVVIDEILEQLEAAKSGVVPGSVVQAVVSGIQNVPTNIVQAKIGGSSSTAYTTFPLSPIVKNCCLDKTYLNLEFDVNLAFQYNINDSFDGKSIKIPIWIGLRDTSSMFNQLQVLIENSAIYTTTYHREESTLSYSSLPETEIRGNNQYASIEKMKKCKYCPMKRIVIESTYTKPAGTVTTKTENITIHFKTTVDINRLTPLLSNLHWTTPHMGNLRLKVFFQEFEKALFFCPDYGYISNIQVPSTATIDALRPLINLSGYPYNLQYWQFYPLNEFFDVDITNDVIPFFALYNEDNNNKPILLDKCSFTNPTNNTNFLDFSNGGIAEIVQTCFDIRDEEYQRLSEHFASIGSVIIPTQTWQSNVFNNSTIPSGSSYPTSQIGTVGGYNINFIEVWNHPVTSPCAMNKEFLQNIQLILDGRPINALPYSYINDKAIVDITQAVIDTDHEEICQDYISSLSFGNNNDENTYMDEPLSTTYTFDTNIESQTRTCLNRATLENPNLCPLAFSTNLPDAFHSGACTLESTNRQGVIRFNATEVKDNIKSGRDHFPLYIDHNNARLGTTVGFSAFCDCCIVLAYDASRGRCYEGQLSWAAPYL